MPAPNFHHSSSAAELARILAQFVAARLREGLARRGKALLVVSGGSTPAPFFEALSQQALDWAAVSVTLADERCVAPDHADSNDRLVRAHLLQGQAAAAFYQPIYQPVTSPELACADVSARLAALPWPADVVVLGLGGDGHTASLFPHDAAWMKGQGGRCVAVPAPEAPNVPVPRLSLSPSALLDARCVIIHIVGEAKMAVLREALKPGPVADLPIRVVLQQSALPCEVFYAP